MKGTTLTIGNIKQAFINTSPVVYDWSENVDGMNLVKDKSSNLINPKDHLSSQKSRKIRIVSNYSLIT